MIPTSSHIDNVIASIEAAENDGPAADPGNGVLDGLSGSKTVGLLQRLAALFQDEPDTCYLEIGVFQGLTLLSVAKYLPSLPCFGIDNFSILDPNGENLGVVEDRMRRLDAKNAILINEDFETALENLDQRLGGRKVGVFFVDGAHDYRSQLIALLLIGRHLHENAVIIVDDANYEFVRRSTRDFLMGHPEFKLLFEAYSPDHPANMSPETLAAWEKDWLNGTHILVRDSDGRLPVMLPPVDDDKTRYVNDWLVHRHGLAELAPDALALAACELEGDTARTEKARATLRARNKDLAKSISGRHADRNTLSARLVHKGVINRPRS